MMQLFAILPLLLVQLHGVSVSAASITITSSPADLNFMDNSYNNGADTSRTYEHQSSSADSQGKARSQPLSIQQQANPIEISANENSTNSSSNQNSRFRVNVSNVCEKNHMRVTVRLSRPFYGLIHAKDKRKKVPCFIEGNGDQSYTLDVSFTLVPLDAAYCGMVAHHLSPSSWTRQQQQQTTLMVAAPANQSTLLPYGGSQQTETLSLALVVRLHKTIEFNDDRYFLLSCPK